VDCRTIEQQARSARLRRALLATFRADGADHLTERELTISVAGATKGSDRCMRRYIFSLLSKDAG
jgi:hypothetical protein